MSEEEKKAIEFLKIFINTEIDYCKLEKTDVIDILNVIKIQDNKIKFLLDNEKSLKEMNRNQMKIIEKQQKELEGKNAVIDTFKHTEKVLTEQLDAQQKEIEEKNCLIDVLQHRIEELLDNKKEINYIKPIDIPVHNYINEDKIREKLKEIESYAFTSKEEKNQQDYAIERIKELLEEN